MDNTKQAIKSSLAGVDNLSPGIWQKVNRAYLRKAIAELMHENLAQAEIEQQDGNTTYFKLCTDNPEVYYTYSAEKRKLDYWNIDRESIIKIENGKPTDVVDAALFFIEMQKTFNIKPFNLTHFIEETNHTLYADAYLEAKGRIASDQLIDQDYQTIEHQMDGHPWATVNKGRLGFNIKDYHQFVPEADQQVKLSWLALHKSKAHYSHIPGLSHESLLRSELGQTLVDCFTKVITDKGLDPALYWFMPVHEWQWTNKIVFQFAGEIACGFIVPLGETEDLYTPQQSIRTFCNTTHPDKYYVKTAISILNTSIYRGLSPEKLAIAPLVTQWVKGLLDRDPYLYRYGFTLLGEVAAVSFKHPLYHQLKETPYQYKEMLGAIWRESATPYLKEDERLMTMASLLYIDSEGKPFIASLIEKSGLSVADWLKVYFASYLKPVLHIFYRHKFFFSPHGENCILVIKDYVPQRIIIKDFVEEIVLTPDAKAQAPEALKGVLREIDDEHASLFILSGIFDAIFRYLSDILKTKLDYEEAFFWDQVKETILDYQAENPDLKPSFESLDLFVPEFLRVCINRVRLLTYGYGESTEIPVPEIAGMLANPIADGTHQKTQNFDAAYSVTS